MTTLPIAVHQCGYFSSRTAVTEHFTVPEIGGEDVLTLLNLGYRHFGNYFFRPVCEGCRRCIPIRVDAARFQPGKTQRRILNRGRRFTIEFSSPRHNQDSFQLYTAHKSRFPENGGGEDYYQFIKSFFQESEYNRQISIKDEEILVAVAHLDILPGALSAVYTYFNPAFAEYSPGTLSILLEISLAQERSIPWVYLGYYIGENRHMRYKNSYYPNQLLVSVNNWRDYRDGKGIILDDSLVAGGFTSIY
ncbi:MAG: arginyltransferase [Spirochaetales bacterium]|nr:arginyltransferase [Spirochaetales bacterium]